MGEPPRVNLDLRPPLLMIRPLPRRVPPHLRNKSIALPTRDPVIRPREQEEELGHAVPVLLVVAQHLPQLVLPLVVGDGVHLLAAHVQRLPQRAGALAEAGGDGRGLGAEAHEVAAPGVQDEGRDEEEEEGEEAVEVGAEEGEGAQEREEAAAGGAGDVGDGRAEEDAVVEAEVRGRGRVALVAREDLQADVGADGVADEHRKVIGAAGGVAAVVAVAQGLRGGGAALGEAGVGDGDDVLEAVGRVLGAEGRVLLVVEAGQAAAVDVEGHVGLDVVEVVAQRVQEAGVPVDEARVARDEVDEGAGAAGGGRLGGWEGDEVGGRHGRGSFGGVHRGLGLWVVGEGDGWVRFG